MILNWYWKKGKIKIYVSSLQNFEHILSSKIFFINNIYCRCEKTKEELAKCIEDKNTLKDERKMLKSSLLEIDHKTAALEESYDQNVTLLNLKKSVLNQEIQAQVTANAKITATVN